MKKIFVLMAGIGLSLNAMAADDTGTAISSGTAIAATAAGCSLLGESVTINLSTSVAGAYACNTTDNVIGVATCHPTGRKGDVTVACIVGDGTTPVGSDPDCVDNDGDGDTATGTKVVQGGLAYTASSAGGRVTGTNAATCTVANPDVTAEAETAAGL